MNSPRVGATTLTAPRARAASAPNDCRVASGSPGKAPEERPTWVPWAMPATAAARNRRAAPPYARAPLGPTQTATGTRAWLIRKASTSRSGPSRRSPGLSSWMTSTSSSSRSAWRTARRTKSASMGSIRPLTSITSTARAAAATAPRGATTSTRLPRTTRTMGSLRIDVLRGGWLDPRGFCRQSRLVIVAGKGGVGKTTVSAALARMAARLGLSALLVEVEGKAGLAATFGAPALEYEEQLLSPATADGTAEVRARTITPDVALVEYLEEHGMRRLSRRLMRSGAVDVVATAAPGIKDILVLGKVKQLERAKAADLIVLDAPAAGHAVRFLTSARGLLDAVN